MAGGMSSYRRKHVAGCVSTNGLGAYMSRLPQMMPPASDGFATKLTDKSIVDVGTFKPKSYSHPMYSKETKRSLFSSSWRARTPSNPCVHEMQEMDFALDSTANFDLFPPAEIFCLRVFRHPTDLLVRLPICQPSARRKQSLPILAVNRMLGFESDVSNSRRDERHCQKPLELDMSQAGNRCAGRQPGVTVQDVRC